MRCFFMMINALEYSYLQRRRINIFKYIININKFIKLQLNQNIKKDF